MIVVYYKCIIWFDFLQDKTLLQKNQLRRGTGGGDGGDSLMEASMCSSLAEPSSLMSCSQTQEHCSSADASDDESRSSGANSCTDDASSSDDDEDQVEENERNMYAHNMSKQKREMGRV